MKKQYNSQLQAQLQMARAENDAQIAKIRYFALMMIYRSENYSYKL